MVFLTSLITKTSDQLGAYPLAKMFLHFEIRTRSSTLNLASLAVESTLYRSSH